jgi:tetratricopeptide (TPR) repeat protein
MVTSSPQRCRVVGAPVSYGLEIFKDRHLQQEQILAWLADPATRMVTVFGRRGIGKSSLAAKIAETLAASADYRGIVNLSTRSDGAITLERIFFMAAEVAEPAERDAIGALWASQRAPRDKLTGLFETLAGGLNLIVLDNIEDQLTDGGQPVSRDLEVFLDVIFRVPRGPRLLVTSQVPIALDPALRRMEARLHLRDGLPVRDSVALLRELDRDGEAGLLDAPEAQLEQAAMRLHGVPRALELTAGALAGDDLTLPTLDEVLADFTSRGDIVDQLAQDQYRRLEEETRLALDVLAVFRSPVRREPVEWVIAPLAPHIDVARALSGLAHVHMVSVDRPTREFALHPLDADIAYAALPATGPFSRRVLERRVAAWYEHTRVPPPWRSIADVASERMAFEHRLRAEDYDACAFILDDASEFMALHGSTRELVGMHFALSGHLTSDAAVLADLVSYGIARHIGGPYEEAIEPLEEAAALAERLGDLPHLRRALFSLGDIRRFLRQLPEAIGTLSRAADVARQLGEAEREAHALLCLSLSHTYLGQLTEALDVAERITRLADETGEPTIRAEAGDALAAAYVVAGRWEEAYQAAGTAVSAYEEAGVPEPLGYARNVRGIALLARGRAGEAIPTLEQARTESVRAQTPRAEGLCCYNLAWAHWMAGDYASAATAARGAVEAFRRAGGSDIDASQDLETAVTAMRAGNPAAAGAALTAAAAAATGNSDLVPGEWLTAAAMRLDEAAAPAATAETGATAETDVAAPGGDA